MMPAIEPVILELADGLARVEPLSMTHAADLLLAAADPEIWNYMPEPQPRSLADVEGFVTRALKRSEGDAEHTFAIVNRATGRCVGSTRYLDIQRENRSLEIGWTWIAKEVQRTRVNTECKYLLMRHAFETCGAIRVQLKTDGRNLRSQNAIMRIGALYEGRLRNHRILHDGFVRDTVYFSVLAAEWPGVKRRLEERLGMRR